jgi:hypothetical protein
MSGPVILVVMNSNHMITKELRQHCHSGIHHVCSCITLLHLPIPFNFVQEENILHTQCLIAFSSQNFSEEDHT